MNLAEDSQLAIVRQAAVPLSPSAHDCYVEEGCSYPPWASRQADIRSLFDHLSAAPSTTSIRPRRVGSWSASGRKRRRKRTKRALVRNMAGPFHFRGTAIWVSHEQVSTVAFNRHAIGVSPPRRGAAATGRALAVLASDRARTRRHRSDRRRGGEGGRGGDYGFRRTTMMAMLASSPLL